MCMDFTQSVRYSCQILLDSNFLDRVCKNTQMSNLIKILPVGAEILHADGRTEGQTDMMKLVVVLSNFAKAPKKPTSFCCSEFGQHGVGLLEGTTEIWMQSVSLIISLWLYSVALSPDEYKR